MLRSVAKAGEGINGLSRHIEALWRTAVARRDGQEGQSWRLSTVESVDAVGGEVAVLLEKRWS